MIGYSIILLSCCWISQYMGVKCILVTWAFNCNLTPQVFLLSASLCCSLSCFPNGPHTSIYSCPLCIALVQNCLLHRTAACTLAGTWVLHETRCSSVSLLCVPSFLFYVNRVLLGVLVLQLKNWILYHLNEWLRIFLAFLPGHRKTVILCHLHVGMSSHIPLWTQSCFYFPGTLRRWIPCTCSTYCQSTTLENNPCTYPVWLSAGKHLF